MSHLDHKRPYLQLGDPRLANMMLYLTTPVTLQNHVDYHFLGSELKQIRPGFWTMPAYLNDYDTMSLFFLFTADDNGEMAVMMASGEWQDGHLGMSAPMKTGAGLNKLYHHRRKNAVKAFNYLLALTMNGKAEWRQLPD
ncbi:hypothetical protein FC82_GL000070 [Secundilactobacillus collinoides DSM 20515 = JCM 1123]|uniref:Uncharacterized protein n=1 Tax=Secundilactobacillus collinoides DSM 20515 = JCM 1123 TaxID=1423733 RepID=A0A0R2BR07_SECCO|nr:hypothetical protein FC82_GL000070 [Secundilactobacillus collinoides DSM 20515 = JCM 1123]